MHSLLNSGADRPSTLLGVVLGGFFLWWYIYRFVVNASVLARRFSHRRGISRRARWVVLGASFLTSGAIVSVLVAIGD